MTGRKMKLGDAVLRIEAGKSIKTLEREAAADEPGVLKVSAVSWGAFDARAAKAVPREYDPPASHKVRKGDLLFSRANTTELTGAVAIAEADFPHRYLSDKTLRLVVDTEVAVPEFLLLALRSPEARAHIEARAGGSSSSMRNISQEAMLAIPLRLPALDAQRVIADRISTALREASLASDAVRTQWELSERLQRKILSESFRVSSPVMAGARNPGAPVGWHWRPLMAAARLESGHTPSRRHPEWWGGDIPWLALPDIRKLHGKVAMQTIENINELGLANSSARLLPAGTVCVSRTASVGFVTILGRPMATSQDFCNWICNPEELNAEFLMYAFMASQDQLRSLGTGAVHKTIYMPTIQSFHICAPTLSEQRRIAHALRDQLASAEALRTSLKTRLGEVERLPARILAHAFGAA